MTTIIPTGAVHHVTLTVSDVERSEAFYNILGFNHIAEFGPVALMHNGSVILSLRPPPDPAQAIDDDRFNENRIGLDHLSFAVGSHADLEAAVEVLDQHSVDRGEITDLPPFQIYILAFRDPDNIQVELTAPYG